jgi:prolyl oligopeptidase
VWLHKLGTGPEEDIQVFKDDKVKEYWHGVGVTEDGRHEVFYRSLFNVNDVWFRPLGGDQELIPLATGMKNEYGTLFVEDKILITTDEDAPRKMVYVTDVANPGRENWKVFLPEHEKDKLQGVSGIAGKIYATYSHNAYTVVKIYELDGTFIRDLPFPTIGTGWVSGRWSQPEVWVSFSSYSYPSTTFKYHVDRNELEVYREFPVEVDVADMVADQVWYPSKDGTEVSMFVVYKKGLKKNGKNPTLLYGYGGFDVSMRPRFSTSALVWLEAGGVYCVANLRGGGEYGRQWHEAGMKENKQNVFDDFIAAAEYLIAAGYTSSDKLAIRGGSNGGLLVGAVTVQRPELFRVVDCGVPLLDMLKYHRYGLANIWAEEYGSSDDAEQFAYLNAYSPYHNVKDGVKYPAFLVTGSENDARVDPLHARKMAARLQAADTGGGPICLLVRGKSGHGGGTTISTQIEQYAQEAAFLMYFLGMEAPH